MKSFDLVIIGGGAAGIAAARRAHALGAKTALVEKEMIGGVRASLSSTLIKTNLGPDRETGWGSKAKLQTVSGDAPGNTRFTTAKKQASEAVASFTYHGYKSPLEEEKGLRLFHGHAKFTGEHEVSVDGQTIRGEKFVIATGARAIIPPWANLNSALTSENLFSLTQALRSVIIVGAGTIGLEVARMFRRFGTRVTIVEREHQILSWVEPEVVKVAQEHLIQPGLHLYTSTNAQGAQRDGGKVEVTIKTGKTRYTRTAQALFLAIGREPNAQELGLDEVDVALDSIGAVVKDDEFATSSAHIYAAGDVTGEPMHQNVAAKEGALAAENALRGARLQMDYEAIPYCVFTDPQIAQVGMTETEAAGRGHEVVTRKLGFGPAPTDDIFQKTQGLLKMTVAKDTRRILGVSLVADGAADLINEAALAIRFRHSYDDLSDTVQVYPTLSEVLSIIAGTFISGRRLPRDIVEELKRAA